MMRLMLGWRGGVRLVLHASAWLFLFSNDVLNPDIT